MDTIKKLLTGEMSVATFVRIMKEDNTVVEALESLIPEEAKTDKNHPCWKHANYDTFIRVGSSAVGYIRYLARFDGSLGDDYDIFSMIKEFYIGSAREQIVISTWYKDAFMLSIQAIPECFEGHEVRGVLDSIINEAMQVKGKGKRIAYIKDRIRMLFSYDGKKRPRWIQGGEWPMGSESPMQFISQCSHGERVDYLFKDVDTGEMRTVTQYY